ncbi:MAG: NFACT RNA binding domain-containing protein [Clostridiales bacterium]|nr:NFACT RNA binding domain-containing protein [Clostridiales bacterium]
MPNDVILLKALADELNSSLKGGRIEKIYQPETDEITVLVKNNGKMHNLVISASPSSPRAHLSTQKKENSLSAPAFCMLLRKHLTGGNISDVSIFNYDRIIKFTIDARNELKDVKKYFLIAELMGRYSNIILTDDNFVIIDAIRRIHFDQSTTRYILPNLNYVLQPKNRVSLDDDAALDEVFSSPISSYDELPKLISGIGKETAKEIFSADNPREKIWELTNIYFETSFCPVVTKNSDGKITDYYVYPYSTVNSDFEKSESLNDALNKFYLLRDGEERKKASSKTVTTVLKRLQAKNERRIEDNLSKIKDKDNAEKNRMAGTLLMNYLWMIKPGDKSVTVDGFDGEKVTIPLVADEKPAVTAKNLLKKYNKQKRAVEIAEIQLEELYKQRDYLKSIEVSITNSFTKTEYEEILKELNSINGYKQNKTEKRQKPSAPTRLKFDCCEIIFGRNNLQNNDVTFKIADRGDLWLHVKNHHGSHVIIKGEYADETLLKAAEIAAYYSDANQDGKVEVDYTLVKFVKKIPSALPGQVTYTNYKTVIVTPKKEN